MSASFTWTERPVMETPKMDWQFLLSFRVITEHVGAGRMLGFWESS